MRASDFFEGIPQVRAHWGDATVPVPTFYQDTRVLSAMFLAPLQQVRNLLPSRRLHPLRPTPWHGLVHIAGYEYRVCDLGPYNEVGISIPVSLDRPAPVFTGLLLPPPAEPDVHILHLPVTTEIACTLGVEFAAYPKFVADIAFSEQGDWVGCRVSEGEQEILTLRVRKGQPKPFPRSRAHAINARDGRLLRAMVVYAERETAISRRRGDANIRLGDHRISQELLDLHLGAMVQCEYTPSMQSILTPVLESFAV